MGASCEGWLASCSYLVTSSFVVVLVVSTIVLLVFASVFEHMLA